MSDWLNKWYYREVPAGPSLIILGLMAIGVIALSRGLVREGILSANYSVRLPEFVNKLTGENNDFQYGSYSALGNAKYFDDARKAFVDAKTSFIEANLTTMKLDVYQDGVAVLEVPILTKGKPGSWWETPAGIYKIETKEKNHFSTFGSVYQPWSMVFQGNFFIHGWPYHEDGTPVASTYSGGCIRLNTDDAKKVYDLVKVNMPVLVYEASFSGDNSSYAFRPPQVKARQYLVADLTNNFVFTEKGKTEVVPIASVVKLVTALTAAEYINLDKKVEITKEMLATTSIPRLEAGREYTTYELLYPLLQESSNEAAVALAHLMPGNSFVNNMNRKALAIGMTHTHFTDPFGGDSGNTSSAEDLFQLSKFLYTNRSFVLKLSAGTLKTTAYDAPDFGDLQNFNIFAGDPAFIGGKIGKTIAAEETMVALFNLQNNGVSHPIAIIALGSPDVGTDIRNLYNYAKNNFALTSNTTSP
ncbi:MAG: L,D-transpeptidase family protein [Candidatus Paceibacterota bacterium]|jgi:D-alanyl-D-alanine carboxypeptidase